MKTFQLARRLKFGFGVPIVLLIALSVVSYRSVVASSAGAAWVRHTQQIIEKFAGLVSALQEVETGYRGFVIAGDNRFLQAYEAGLAEAPADLASITALMADNSGQKNRTARLTTLIRQKIEFGEQVVRLRREDGVRAASELVTAGDGVRLMDDIRSLIGEMRADEERLLAARQAIAARNFWRIALVLGLGILGSVVVLVAAGWMVMRDVTARADSELALRKSEESLRMAKDSAEAANRAKGEFLANMSHEIRTPMNGVIGMTDLVLDTELTPEQRENLRIVKSSAGALLTVINDILDFSRMEAGKFELDPIDFSPRDAIGDTAESVALRAHQKGLELVVDVDATVPQRVIGDAGRLRQILLNLLGNAIKFTAQGEIVVHVTTESAAADGVMLHVSVKDTGIGIPLERQASVFEAFTQADGSVTRTHGGTGLGLTIASQLVRLMGGRVWVQSEVGRGSTFHFTVNFALARDAAVASDPDAVDLRELSVLIVDDNATNRHLLEGILTGWHMVSTSTASAAEALVALRAAQATGRPFHVVLTDSQMPVSDGFALAAAIKKDPLIAGATVVILTSGGQPGDAARCRELGIAAYLPKPIKRTDLHDAMLLALGVPSAQRERPALITRHSVREARHTGRILLVEDNSVNQLVARRLLEKRGYTVTLANNGKEALAILAEATAIGFGCVLMDVQMPEMDGFQCTAIIREREKVTGGHLPIIAMTAHAMTGDDTRCLEAGMDAYLTKPIQPDAFFETVERHLRIATVSVLPVKKPHTAL